MALEGPQLRYVRTDEMEAEPTLDKALRLAREIEDLLEHAPSSPAPNAHGPRMAHAMAASLVDELEALVRGQRKSGVA